MNGLDRDLWLKNLQKAYKKMNHRKPRNLWETIRRLNVEVTSACQANCVFCFREEYMKRFNAHYMPTGDVKRFIEQITNFTQKIGSRLQVINFGLNGEPLLHPRIAELVAYAKDKARIVRISTNLDKLTPSMSKNLLDAGLSSICFSIDECEKERFESIRRNLDFDKTVKHAGEFKRIRDDGFYNCKITVSPVDCKETEGRHNQIKRFWSKISDARVQMSREIPIAHNLTRVQPWFDIIHIPACVDMIGLKSNGDVLPCCFDVFHEYPLGNLYRQPIEEIFYGKRAEWLREKLRTLKEIPPSCEICVSLPQFQTEDVREAIQLYG